MASYVIGVVGNPNCGKTTLFNALTGARQRVGNWPGVTVERKTGEYAFDGDRFQVVDLPGTYALSAHSQDERIAREYVLSGEPDVIVNIADGSNLERNLYLTMQLIEARVPLVVALNMMDVVRSTRIVIDVPRLAEQLGCPVVPIVARTGEGIDELRRTVARQAREPRVSPTHIEYPAEVEEGIAAITDAVRDRATGAGADARWLAVKLLEDDAWAQELAGDLAAEPL
ncbi:MAG: FeoB small GTPase domain-containing protein, partial [bacterium]